MEENLNQNPFMQKRKTIAEQKSGKEQLFEYVNLLKKNLGVFLAIFISILAATVIYVQNADQIYRNQLLLKIEKEKNTGLVSSNLLGDELGSLKDNRYILNEINLLQSYEIRDRVAHAILNALDSVDIEDPVFLVTKNRETEEVSRIDVNTLRKKLKNVSISQYSRDVDIIQIELEGRNFKEISFINSIYAREYINHKLEKSVEDVEKVKSFLEAEKRRRLNGLRNLEQELSEFQKDHGVLELTAKETVLLESSVRYEDLLANAKTELQRLQEEKELIKDQISDIDTALYNWVNNSINNTSMKILQEKISQLELEKEFELMNARESQKAEIINNYDEKISVVRTQLDKYFDDYKKSMNTGTPELKQSYINQLMEINLRILGAEASIEHYNKLIVELNKEQQRLPEISRRYLQIKRELTTNERLYLSIEEKFQESEILQRSRVAMAYVLDPGLDGNAPVKPKTTQVYTIGFILALALGFGYLVIINIFRRYIMDPEEIEKTGFPVLSWIPKMEEEKGKITRIYVNERPTSTISESFKALRTRLMYSKLDEKPLKRILVTSTIPSEGKTTVTVNTAAAFAQLGKRVLVIDCDLRKPRMHNFFKVEKKPGLSDYLFQKVKLDDIIVEKEGLFFIPSGTIPPNPSELLNSHFVNDFLKEVDERFDYIFLDSPPFVTVTDSEILSRLADGTILVSRANFTPNDLFKNSVVKFDSNNPRSLLGVVLNDFSYKDSYGSYYKYYYYYYSDEDRDKKGSGKKDK